jgi:Ni/Co efflux regulator RcnB
MITTNKAPNMRRLLIAAVLVALVPAPVLAQAPKGAPTERTDADKKRDAEIDKAYRDSLKRNSVAPPAKSDPWGTIRPANTDTTKQR